MEIDGFTVAGRKGSKKGKIDKHQNVEEGNYSHPQKVRSEIKETNKRELKEMDVLPRVTVEMVTFVWNPRNKQLEKTLVEELTAELKPPQHNHSWWYGGIDKTLSRN